MAYKLFFPHTLNVSVQPTDILYIALCNITPGVFPAADDYIFFSKDRRANISGVVGYFAETKYVNDSKNKTEMFATAIDYAESSS